MPFTPSHAIVALPFVRTPLPAAAIAIGAMTPDLPLFLRGTPIDYKWTHDPVWLPATVVLAFVLLVLWRCVLRPAASELVPAAIARRLPVAWDLGAGAAFKETLAPRARPWQAGMLLLIVALALGVLSHLAWDAFSHEGRAGVLLIPALASAWGPLPGYKWVQHGSSIVGVVVLAVWSLLWFRRTGAGTLHRVLPAWMPGVWLAALPASLLVAWGIGLGVYGPLTADFTAQHLAYRVLPPACAAWGLLTVAVAVIVQARRAAAQSKRVGDTSSDTGE
ncbi:DUF4184 family protein [Microbacterium protaetiae]|uniref:DUF4184 family protein n=1 Tax=Microbacterium protaetiae TaxID=2509458 RepID=A0A4P6EG48_9MICO|nr:DUF4184 family protein [Microbacterium protaetiae]QAY60846.1 DUF4184 family protein [Microbacterium protaetiae]